MWTVAWCISCRYRGFSYQGQQLKYASTISGSIQLQFAVSTSRLAGLILLPALHWLHSSYFPSCRKLVWRTLAAGLSLEDMICTPPSPFIHFSEVRANRPQYIVKVDVVWDRRGCCGVTGAAERSSIQCSAQRLLRSYWRCPNDSPTQECQVSWNGILMLYRHKRLLPGQPTMSVHKIASWMIVLLQIVPKKWQNSEETTDWYFTRKYTSIIQLITKKLFVNMRQ